MAYTYTENHGKAFDATHIRRFQVTLGHRVSLRNALSKTINTYHTDKVLIPHLLDRNVVNQARYDGSRPCLFAKIDLLEYKGDAP